MPQTRRSYRPPSYPPRRRFPIRWLVAAIVVIVAVYLIAGACSGGKKKTAKNPAGTPTAALAPSSRASGANGTPRPGGTPSTSSFAPASPTPQATCAPSDLLRLVDKDHALPDDYTPPDLVTLEPKDASPGSATLVQMRKAAADALHAMLEAARAQNIFCMAQSAYRSYEYQNQVYAAEVRSVGQ